MQLALIPPRGLYKIAELTDMHLALAQISEDSYMRQHERLGLNPDRFVIVDNGAAEGTPVGDALLIERAWRYHAKELVIPDHMGDKDLTLRRLKMFLTNWKDFHNRPEVDFMGVVQGRNDLQIMRCVEAYAATGEVHTIGIPRILITQYKDPDVRIRLSRAIHQAFPAFGIHFLGTNPEALPEVYRAASAAPWVRSVDTSLPFNYALAGVKLSFTSPVIKRPDNYFRTDFGSPMSFNYLRENVTTMIRWARGYTD